MDEYPPGSFGDEMNKFERQVEMLPWPVRWFWRRRVRYVRANFAKLRDASLREWFLRHW